MTDRHTDTSTLYIDHHHQDKENLPSARLFGIMDDGFQMREAVIVFATENKYGAQVHQRHNTMT